MLLPLLPRNTRFPSLLLTTARSPMSSSSSPAAAARVAAEYAKSGRSTCKGCAKGIAMGALRVGTSLRDPRGFESTKWYHLNCFPASPHPLAPVEKIKGFASLKDLDQEELRKREEVVAAPDQSARNHKRDGDAVGQPKEPNPKKSKVHGMAESGSKEGEGKNFEEGKSSAEHERISFGMPFSPSDIKDKYKDASLPSNWKAFKTVIFREREDSLCDSAKIAAFDFDGCLAKTSVRSIGADKWSLQHQSIPERLQRLYNDGYKLVIFTNESNIDRWKNKRQQAVDSKVGRLDNFIKCIKVPIQVFIACGTGKDKGSPEDPFRKPNPGMWRLMEDQFNSGITIDMDKSFYVGDAAGRRDDHGDADIKFAEAIGLKFYVPEDYFCA